MKITQAKWQDANHTLCRAVVDGVTMSVPEGSPHWPYLQKAIAEGLVVEGADPEPTAEEKLDATAGQEVNTKALTSFALALKEQFPVLDVVKSASRAKAIWKTL